MKKSIQKRLSGAAALVVLMVVLIGAAGNINTDAYTKYVATDGRYEMKLNKDGTFFFIDFASSILTVDDADNLYRWDSDMLVLEFGASDDVMYFCQRGNALVFQKSLSVCEENPSISDGKVFKKM